MRFNIGLSDYIKAKFICEVQKRRIIWIMGCPYGVEIKFLHFYEICSHIRYRYNATRLAIEIVTVDAVNNHSLAVN